ncbi:MAG: YDG domain-containing protein, partial [Bacteroidales bacterium]|nr:YDG domain-containing protein [Bacteroidales bacterium]
LITGSDNNTEPDGDTGVDDATHTLEVRAAALSHFIVKGVGGTPDEDGYTEHYYGDPQSVTVEAIDIFGNIKTNYTGTITFNLTDDLAVAGTNYPVDYTFNVDDNGSHTFTDEILFTRPSFEHPDYDDVDEWWVTVIDQAQPWRFGAQEKIRVLARPINVIADNQTKNYYGDTHDLGSTAFTVTSGIGEDAAIFAGGESITSVTLASTGTAATALAGDHDIVPSSATGINEFNPDYYNINYVNGTLNVVQRPITIVVDAGQNKVYSHSDPTFTYQITSSAPFDALVNGDVFDGLLTRETGEDVADDYTISKGGLTIINGVDNKENNYNITFVEADFEITPWQLVLSSFNASDKTYDASTDASLTFDDNRPHAGDDITFSTIANFVNRHVNWNGTAQPKDVNFTITIDGGAQAGNYVFSTVAPNSSDENTLWSGITTATINQRPINVTAQAVSRVYDGTIASDILPVAQDDQLVGDDEITVVGIQTYDDANVGEDKTLAPSGTVISDGNSGNNYTINYVAQDLGVITKREITVDITGNPTKVYDATNVATLIADDYSINNLVTGESITINQTTGTYNSADVGEHPDRTVSVTLAESNYDPEAGTLLSNYNLPVSAIGGGTITKFPLTLDAFVAADKTYDGTTPTTITFTNNVFGGDDVTFDYTADFSDRNVNWDADAAQTKTVTYSVTFSGDDAGNYMFATGGANTGDDTSWEGTTTATINQRPIDVTAQAVSRVYDGTINSYNVDGPVYPEVQTSQLVGSDAVSVAGIQTYDNKNVGTAKTLTPSGTVINDGIDGNNYAITYVPQDLGEITQLAITGNFTAEDKVYDGKVMVWSLWTVFFQI